MRLVINMAKIIKRKSDNLVIAVLDDNNVINLGSNGSTYDNGQTYDQDMTDSTHEIVTGVTAPTKFFSGYFTYDTDWSLDTVSLNRYNEMADEVGLPRIEAEL
jgi:deoxycytidylate deaminase|tara:strand:+ start:716 stop:1024 length:309 start_codon:yes stop_codon:yes gene_type:complete